MLESSRLEGLENIASRAAAIATWNAETGNADHLAEELAALRAVTKESVQASAEKWMAESAAVTMTVTAAPKKKGGAK